MKLSIINCGMSNIGCETGVRLKPLMWFAAASAVPHQGNRERRRVTRSHPAFTSPPDGERMDLPAVTAFGEGNHMWTDRTLQFRSSGSKLPRGRSPFLLFRAVSAFF